MWRIIWIEMLTYATIKIKFIQSIYLEICICKLTYLSQPLEISPHSCICIPCSPGVNPSTVPSMIHPFGICANLITPLIRLPTLYPEFPPSIDTALKPSVKVKYNPILIIISSYKLRVIIYTYIRYICMNIYFKNILFLFLSRKFFLHNVPILFLIFLIFCDLNGELDPSQYSAYILHTHKRLKISSLGEMK